MCDGGSADVEKTGGSAVMKWLYKAAMNRPATLTLLLDLTHTSCLLSMFPDLFPGYKWEPLRCSGWPSAEKLQQRASSRRSAAATAAAMAVTGNSPPGAAPGGLELQPRRAIASKKLHQPRHRAPSHRLLDRRVVRAQ